MKKNSHPGGLIAIASVVACLSATPANTVEAAGRLAALRANRVAALEAAATPPMTPPALIDPTGAIAPPYAPAGAPCCPQRCIIYRHHGPKLCCGCELSVPTTLTVQDPCTCCPIDISVCLPACCTDSPTVACGRGLLGRDLVTYEWCCGFRVTVRFRHNGDLVVVTHGA